MDKDSKIKIIQDMKDDKLKLAEYITDGKKTYKIERKYSGTQTFEEVFAQIIQSHSQR